MLGSAGIFAIVLCIGMIKLPESPRYLIKNGMADKAREVLRTLRSSAAEVEAEVSEIQSVAVHEQSGIKSCFRKSFV